MQQQNYLTILIYTHYQYAQQWKLLSTNNKQPIYSHWRLGVVASVVRRMNKVTVHWARLVLGWVTVFGRVYHHGV